MRRLVVKISEIEYERICFEALSEKKSIGDIVRARIFSIPFSKEIEDAVGDLIEIEIQKIFKEKVHDNFDDSKSYKGTTNPDRGILP